ncbi:response regulator transcription factor [Ramlibacter sp. G-1-2-2]|uniref:Response regulator transcription factor n=1 Tax=Ramlibacter agri TaxID=2728837 RepID=A0A848H424_9BURK|nr:response regulator transcription factor [Ramlibacter agri]NML43393.1 response regulator transcription factor [Ramlibacter agri]
MQSIKVILADDHDLVRTGIKAVLLAIPGVEVVGEARDGEQLLALLERVRPDVVVTDISMPGIDGISAIARIHQRHPELPVLMLSMYETPDFIRRAVAAGARGYVPKGASAQELEQALRSVVSSGSYFSRAVTQQLLKPAETPPTELLTDRQLEILRMMAQGKSSKEIGFDLGLSSKTVDAHRARIMGRLGIGDLASLTLYAVRKGLVAL